jgi:hypothetical protein
MAGTSNVNDVGSFGVQGVSADSNTPRGRFQAMTWCGLDGHLYQFGGNWANGIEDMFVLRFLPTLALMIASPCSG